MLNQAIISTPAPPLHPDDTVGQALELFEDLKVDHWPVVEEGVFKGLISEDTLMDSDKEQTISELHFDLLPFSVSTDEHFLMALRLMSERRLSVLAATSPDNEYVGVILPENLLSKVASLLGTHTPGGLLVLEVNPADFSVGEISRLIETNNAQIRQLNTQFDQTSGLYQVTIRINKQEVSDIIATFQRYDYRVVYFVGEEQYENELRRNYHHLLHFLDL